MLEDGIYGEKISKTEIKDFIRDKQTQIYSKFKELFREFGKEFTTFTMESILKQKKIFMKNINLFFID